MTTIAIIDAESQLTKISEKFKNSSGRYAAKYLCSCGKEKFISCYDVLRGHTKSCGCLWKVKITSHGLSRSKTYRIWQDMKSRCVNTEDTAYHDYGGRGITVCDRWLESFENFLEDMGKHRGDSSLDRIRVNGNYCKDNCRWADRGLQQHNQRKRSGKTSNFYGVCLDKQTGKWCASLVYKEVRHLYKLFDTEVDAAKAYDDASFTVFGDRPNKETILTFKETKN